MRKRDAPYVLMRILVAGLALVIFKGLVDAFTDLDNYTIVLTFLYSAWIVEQGFKMNQCMGSGPTNWRQFYHVLKEVYTITKRSKNMAEVIAAYEYAGTVYVEVTRNGEVREIEFESWAEAFSRYPSLEQRRE